MADIKSDKHQKSSEDDDTVSTQCFQCGHEVILTAIRLEAMSQTGQDVYCENCDEDRDEDGDVFMFVPFF